MGAKAPPCRSSTRPCLASSSEAAKVAAAAERRDTARALWEASEDPGTSVVVRDAVAASRRALAEVRR